MIFNMKYVSTKMLHVLLRLCSHFAYEDTTIIDKISNTEVTLIIAIDIIGLKEPRYSVISFRSLTPESGATHKAKASHAYLDLH